MNTKYNKGAHKKGKELQLRMNVLTKVFLNIQKDSFVGKTKEITTDS